MNFSPSNYQGIVQTVQEPTNKSPCTIQECSVCQYRLGCNKYTELLENIMTQSIKNQQVQVQTAQITQTQQVQPVQQTAQLNVESVQSNILDIEPIIEILESLSNKVIELDNKIESVTNMPIENEIQIEQSPTNFKIASLNEIVAEKVQTKRTLKATPIKNISIEDTIYENDNIEEISVIENNNIENGLSLYNPDQLTEKPKIIIDENGKIKELSKNLFGKEVYKKVKGS